MGNAAPEPITYTEVREIVQGQNPSSAAAPTHCDVDAAADCLETLTGVAPARAYVAGLLTAHGSAGRPTLDHVRKAADAYRRPGCKSKPGSGAAAASDADVPRRRVAATPRLRRGSSVDTRA